MNVREKTLLEIIAESAGKHREESPEMSAQPIKQKSVRAVSSTRKQARKQAKISPQTERKQTEKKIDEYLEMIEGMLS